MLFRSGSQQEADNKDSKTLDAESPPNESSPDYIQVEQFTDLDLTETIIETSAYHLCRATAYNQQSWVLTPPEKSVETIEVSEFKPFVEITERWDRMSPHQYITSVYGSGDHPLPWVAFEPCGDTALIDHVDTLSPSETLDVLQQICDALHHVHRYGTTYENLTTESILYTTDGQIKLYGVLDQFDESNPWYNAPEEFDGGSTERSTVYRVGLIAYELFTGRLPYEAHPDGDPKEAIESEESHNALGSTERLPPELTDELVKALSKNPADRHETVLHLRDSFSAIVSK